MRQKLQVSQEEINRICVFKEDEGFSDQAVDDKQFETFRYNESKGKEEVIFGKDEVYDNLKIQESALLNHLQKHEEKKT